jgi:hypothetical protein
MTSTTTVIAGEPLEAGALVRVQLENGREVAYRLQKPLSGAPPWETLGAAATGEPVQVRRLVRPGSATEKPEKSDG